MIDVELLQELGRISSHRAEIEALNLASARRCPFTTWGLLEAYATHHPDFAGPQGARPWFLAAFESGKLIGYLALRRTPGRWRRLSGPRVEPWIVLEVDRPHLVARPEDEARVADAVLGALKRRRAQWNLLELTQQDADSALARASLPFSPPGYLVRRVAGRQNTTVPVKWRTVPEYVAALDGKMRSNVKRMVLATLKLGRGEVYSSRDEAGALGLFDVYLELERKSWKAKDEGGAALFQDPARVRYYRELFLAAQPMRLFVELFFLEGNPVAGQIVGDYARRLYHLQTVFDQAYAAVSPGALITLLAMRRAIEGGYEAFNQLPDFAYYKRKWLGEVTPTENLQIFRAPSPLGARALLGEVKRRWKGAREAGGGFFNPYKRAAMAAGGAAPAAKDPSQNVPLQPPPVVPVALEPRVAALARTQSLEHLDDAAVRAVFAFLSPARTGGR